MSWLRNIYTGLDTLTWFIIKSRISSSRALLAIPSPNHFGICYFMLNISILTQESRIIIAIEAIQTSRKWMSRRAAAKLYDVFETTLCNRITGRPARQILRPGRMSNKYSLPFEERQTPAAPCIAMPNTGAKIAGADMKCMVIIWNLSYRWSKF